MQQMENRKRKNLLLCHTWLHYFTQKHAFLQESACFYLFHQLKIECYRLGVEAPVVAAVAGVVELVSAVVDTVAVALLAQLEPVQAGHFQVAPHWRPVEQRIVAK